MTTISSATTDTAQVESASSWSDDHADLLTFEEGLTGHPLSGAYICVDKTRA